MRRRRAKVQRGETEIKERVSKSRTWRRKMEERPSNHTYGGEDEKGIDGKEGEKRHRRGREMEQDLSKSRRGGEGRAMEKRYRWGTV